MYRDHVDDVLVLIFSLENLQYTACTCKHTYKQFITSHCMCWSQQLNKVYLCVQVPINFCIHSKILALLLLY